MSAPCTTTTEETKKEGTLQAILYQPPRSSPPQQGGLLGPDLGQLKVLDQLKLPVRHEYIEVRNCQEAWTVIRNMNVRGAPAIAIVGCLGLALEVQQKLADLKASEEGDDSVAKENLSRFILEKLEYLESSRPTAVNLRRASLDIRALVSSHLSQQQKQQQLPSTSSPSATAAATAASMAEAVVKYAEDLLRTDIEINRSLSREGARHILERAKESNSRLSVLTHCNTGSLATGGHGTALGIVRDLHAAGRLEVAYCTETRPYNQGSRLTAYELVYDKIPSCYICDDAAAALMSTKRISAVIVGADRVSRNGDVANKIGTLQLAIVAKHLGVPFYVACPTNSIDLATASGSQIKIEERKEEEMVTWVEDEHGGPKKRIPPEGISCWNPAFDVTPAELITGGIVTEYGVFNPPLDDPKTLQCLKLSLN